MCCFRISCRTFLSDNRFCMVSDGSSVKALFDGAITVMESGTKQTFHKRIYNEKLFKTTNEIYSTNRIQSKQYHYGTKLHLGSLVQ